MRVHENHRRLPHSSDESAGASTSPEMDPLPEKKPKMSSTSLVTGTNFATGSPCLVITTVSCLAFTSSMMARQFALNFPAAIVFIGITPWSLYHGYARRQQTSQGLRLGGLALTPIGL